MELLFFIKPIAYLLLFAVIFYGIGKALLVGLFKLPKSSTSVFLNSVMGMCYVIIGVFVLLSLNLLTITSAWIVILAPVVFAGCFSPTVFSVNWHEVALKKHYALIALILAFWFSVAIRVFLPEAGADALAYHLPYAKSFAKAGGLTLELYLRYPLNALNFDLLFTLGYLFEGETLARMFSLYAALLLMVGIYSLGLIFFNTVVATIATWIFISSQLILNIMHSAYIDLGFALFVLAAVYALLLYKDEENKSCLPVVAVFLGIALGTKYLGLLVVPSVLCWMYFLVKDKKLWALSVLLVVVVASPWYIRSLWISGNPIHPFAQPLFGFWLWTPTDLLNQNSDLFSDNGVARNWLNLIKLPWFIWQDTYARIGPTNSLFIFSLPIALIGLTQPGVVRQLAVFSLFHLMAWFYTSQIMRYLIYLLPFLSLLIAYYMVGLFSWLVSLIVGSRLTQRLTQRLSQKLPQNFKGWRMSSPQQHLLGGFFLLVSAVSSLNYHHQEITQHVIPSSAQSWQDLLQKKPEYLLVKTANEQGGKTTMKLGFPYVAHYFTQPFKGDYFGTANMAEFTDAGTSNENLLLQMQALDAQLLLIDKNHTNYDQLLPILQKSQDFELLLENSKGYLFQVK